MRIGVPRETLDGERRVALLPDAVGRLVKAGVEVAVEHGAGAAAFSADDAYAASGARLASPEEVWGRSDLVVKVRRPSDAEIARLHDEGATVIALLGPGASDAFLARLNERRASFLALERVPRITRAQSMDVLSSQATVAGYKAVLLGAAELPRLLPMLTTAAGTLAPGRVFVLGAGVAGLQAIATARRLGAVVSAFDIRAAAAEQVKSLGASFVSSELASAAAETAGGYARAQTSDERARTLAAIADHLPGVDLVIGTAQIPGKPAPELITGAMLERMRPGSVVVDLAAETGGNCAVTRPGERVEVGSVVVLGPLNVAASMPVHASQMFSRNVLTLVQHLVKDAKLVLDPNEEITRAMLLTHRGQVFAP
ncbi:MAG TPA: NAD(P) transhydrogenase subunit alpha [Myxococcaceae bacterium]|jgi:NAD(P) transhydrogenase subunit alpha|nr:NAD(P) transhydrogenase subunit alpha [Myxococcaceae bacterium]